VEFFANQMIDLFSPTNYLATNPDALERAVETEGMSLVQGLENMVRDIESHHGELLPTLADPAAFEVGGTSRRPKGRSSTATA
jgi:polyhydroxyalkanoate synthase